MPSHAVSPVRAALAIATALALTLLIPARPASAAPEVMSQAPDDAELVVAVPNLENLNERIAALQESANIPVPAMRDVLGMLQQISGMRKGLDTNGGMLLTFSGLGETIKNETPPDVAFVMPVTDYEAFVQNFGGDGNGVSEIQVPAASGRPRPGYARQVSNYAVVSKKQEVAENYEPGGAIECFSDAAGSLGNRYMDQSEILVWADAPALAEAVTPKIRQSLKVARMQMAQQAQGSPMVETVQAFARIGGDALIAVLEDARSLVLGLELGDAGIALNLAVQGTEQGPLDRYFSAQSQRHAELLNQLPGGDYLIATAYDMEGFAAADLLEQAIEQLPGQGEEDAYPLTSVVTGSLPLARQMRGAVQGVYLNQDQQAMMQGGPFQTLLVYQVQDPAGMRDQMQQYMDQLAGVGFEVPEQAMAAQGQGGSDAPPSPEEDDSDGGKIEFQTEYERDVEQVEANGQTVSIDRYYYSLEGLEDVQGAAAQNTTVEGYLAAVGDQYVVATNQPDMEVLKRGMGAIGQPDGLGQASGIQNVRSQGLPPNPIVTSYVSVGGLAKLGNQYIPMAAMFTGQQMEPIEVPEEVPPLVMGLGTEDAGLAWRFYIPSESSRFLSEVAQEKIIPLVMQLQQQGGGQGPSGPGGPGGQPRGMPSQPGSGQGEGNGAPPAPDQ